MDYSGRRLALQRQLTAAGVNLIAIAPGPDMFYLMGFYPHPDERPCYLLLTTDHQALVVPELNATETAAHVQIPLSVYKDEDGPVAVIQSLATSMGFARAQKILVNESMRTDFALLLQEQIDGARLGIATPLLGALRLRKDPEEIAVLHANAAQADHAMQAAFGALVPGISEREVVGVIEAAFAAAGASRLGFAIVGSGPNSSFPHHTAGSRTLNVAEPVVIDLGGTFNAYHSDLTRMAFMGEPSAEYRAVHRVVEAAVQAALSAAVPGAPAHAVDDAARGVITAAGYGEFFTHRTGHGLGLEIHEPPYMTATSSVVLEEGMCFSIEPGIYVPGKFGIRLEEIVIITSSGPAILSKLPREVVEVG